MNEQAMLFAKLPELAAVNESSGAAQGAPRVLLAERNQIEGEKGQGLGVRL